MKYLLPDSLMNPPEPLSVTVLGAGGTGGEVLNLLVRLHMGLLALGSQGLQVRVYDPAVFREANLGRQRCLPSEVGQYKALALVNRINLAFGLAWEAYPAAINGEALVENVPDILIGCVDKARVRQDIANTFSDSRHDAYGDYFDTCLWLDMGNSRYQGQAVLGELLHDRTNEFRLPHVADLFPALSQPEQFDEDDTPSCSLAEVIGPNGQDLLINPIVANHGINLLWLLLTTGVLENHGVIVDSRAMTTMPMPVSQEAWAFYGYSGSKIEKAA